MHSAPKSPGQQLADALAQTSTLKGVFRVEWGVAKLAGSGEAPRIVLYPVGGNYDGAKRRSALVDLPLTIAARVWAKNDDHAWDGQVRLFRALEEHGIAGGPWWEAGDIHFNTDPETTASGGYLEVTFRTRFPIDRVAAPTGRVDEVELSKA